MMDETFGGRSGLPLACLIEQARPEYSGATAPDSHRLPRAETVCILEPPPGMSMRLRHSERIFVKTTRIILLCLPASAALRRGCFPADDPLDPLSEAEAASIARQLERPARILCSPAAGARQFAQALSLPALAEPALAEADHGRWAGLPLKTIEADEPDALAAWLADPAAAPHGGESQLDLLARVGRWLELTAQKEGDTLALTHASVVRAAVVYALQAPPTAMQRLDIAPKTVTRFTVFGGRLRLAGCACPLPD
jgi:broad specificity phosphatase PhoE